MDIGNMVNRSVRFGLGNNNADALHDSRIGDTKMDDLISRQAAIDAVNTALFPKINTAKDAEKALRGVPSAQPEIIRCKDCKHRHEAECPMYHEEDIEWDDDGYIERETIYHDWTEDDGYCDRGERRTDGVDS